MDVPLLAAPYFLASRIARSALVNLVDATTFMDYRLVPSIIGLRSLAVLPIALLDDFDIPSPSSSLVVFIPFPDPDPHQQPTSIPKHDSKTN